MDNIEIWKPVNGYEGLYEVSNFGRVRSLNYNRTGKAKELKLLKHSAGYHTVSLCKDHNPIRCYVHRLVAEAFIPNTDNLPEVDHIIPISCGGTDEVTNLRWVDSAGNSRNEITLMKNKEAHINGKLSKKVYQYTLDNKLVKVWESTMECARHGFHNGVIACCCNKKTGFKTHKGYKWSYYPL